MVADRVTNIGRGEQQKRFRFGILMLAVAAVLGGVLLAINASVWWRFIVAVPLWFGGIGVFQAHEKT